MDAITKEAVANLLMLKIEKAKIKEKLFHLQRIKPKQGYITVVVTEDIDVQFVPENAVMHILEDSDRGKRRAVKVRLVDENGKETVGWVDRRLFDWQDINKKTKEKLDVVKTEIREIQDVILDKN